MNFSGNIIGQIFTLLLAATPLSLLVIQLMQKVFFKHQKKLGEITTICTPVIGTLTKNQLSVQSIVFDKYQVKTEESSEFLNVYNKEEKTSFQVEQRELKKEIPLNLMAATVTLCHYPKHERIEEIIGEFFSKCNLHKHQIQLQYDVIQDIPSTREKKISTIIAIKKETDEIFAFNKGNPRKLLQHCTKILINGKKEELNYEIRRKLIRTIKNLNKRGQKLVAFAYKGLPLKRYEHYTAAFTENDLTFVGIVGLGNFLNLEIGAKISAVKKAGIKIYILGKNEEKEEVGIAEELKIINPRYFETISNDQLAELDDQKLGKMLENKDKDYVFYKLSDQDQTRVVKVLKASGEKVMMLGNEEKSDLEFLAEQIKKGRALRFNLQKVYAHILATKVTIITLLLSAIVMKTPSPLNFGIIIILDLIINLTVQLSLEKKSREEGQENKLPSEARLIFKGLINGIIISIFYVFTLVRFGWYPGDIMAMTTDGSSKFLSLIFILLLANGIIGGYQIAGSKVTNKSFLLTIAGVVLVGYLLLKFSVFTLGVPEAIDVIMIIFALLLMFMADLGFNRLIKKHG